MGTPSYMAPEQASGRTREVGVLSDVYALGAILYELLTGRPPFRAETEMDTILQVLDRDPPRPRTLNPRIDVDLETICLKCLEKEPRNRYSSALALAEDLERWRDGRTIQARPSGPTKKVFKWAKRKPALAILLVVLAAWYFNVRLPWQWAWLPWLFYGLFVGSFIVMGLLRLLVIWGRVTAKLPVAPLDFAQDAYMLSAPLAATLVLCFYQGDLADRTTLAFALLLCYFYAGQTVQWLWRRKQAGPLVMALHAPGAVFFGSVLVLFGILLIANLVNGSAQTRDTLVHVCSSITVLSGLAFLLLWVCAGVQLRKMGCVTFSRFVPWEAIEGCEWKPSGSKDRLLFLLKLKLRESPAVFLATVHPAKKGAIDRILMEHLPQSAHPTDSDPLQTFDLTSWSERTPADRMSGPALLLGLGGLMQVLGALLMLWLVGVMGLRDNQPDFMKLITMFVLLLLGLASLCSGLIVLNGARNMRKLKNYRFCRFSAVLAMLPLGMGFVLGLPFGIWALVVLRRADVRAAFAQSA
jgi:hypothetical protein